MLTPIDLVCEQAKRSAEAFRAAAVDWHAATGPVKTLDCTALSTILFAALEVKGWMSNMSERSIHTVLAIKELL